MKERIFDVITRLRKRLHDKLHDASPSSLDPLEHSHSGDNNMHLFILEAALESAMTIFKPVN